MEITEIKQKLPIRKVLHHYNLTPDKNNMLRCPFHNDKTPSMKIYPETNTWTCFSSNCTAGTGDQIEFIQKMENLNTSTSSAQAKHQAILKAHSLINNGFETGTKSGKHIQQFNHVTMQQFNNVKIINKIFQTFKNGLQSPHSKKPQEYLKSRHLWPMSEVEAGYNSGQFHHRGALSEQEFSACIKAGLLIPNKSGNGNQVFAKDCIIFPLKNKTGEIVSLYGRSINNTSTSSAQRKSGKHYYLKNRTGLYPAYPEEETEILILTESIIDAATLLQYPEITNNYTILALYGTNGLTPEHTEAIKNIEQLKEIIFFFDGDEAGRTATNKHTQTLKSILKNCKISTTETPDNEDINSLLDGHDQEIFKHLLNNRLALSEVEGKQLFLSIEKPLTEPKAPEELKETEEPKEPEAKRLPTVDCRLNKDNKLNVNNPDYIILTTNELTMTILGGINLQQLDRLRITIKITHLSNSVRNNIDLYNIDQTDRFINKAAEKLETGSTILNKAISELTDKLEAYRLNKLESMKSRKPKDRKLTAKREQAAINYLKQKNLLQRTNQDIGKTGVIGEENNRLLMYLIFTSRLRKQPLHIISLGGSGTGKTYLQEKISELIPEQEKKEITILSENAFYYFEKTELKHKVVLIEDMDGAEQVLYPLRELQSKRKISKTVPVKDSKGNLKTITLNVEGPICLAGTTTKERLYEDNANRSILIYLDNSKEHKEKIMNYQRKLSAGKIDTKKEGEIKEMFKDIQTVLKPVKVRNPYAEQLKIPEHVFKPLRTNSHYLAFIETITFYHQYQRTLKTYTGTGSPMCESYIETTIEDIEEANKLIKDVLLAKSDELTKTVREFFESLKKWINRNKKQSFYSKELQERLRIYPMKINRYLRELESRNFIRRTGGNRKKGFEYEIYRTDEYTKLQSGINILDDILEKIKTGTPKPRQD